MVTFRQVVYLIGTHSRDYPEKIITMELLTKLCGLDEKNQIERIRVYSAICHYPELFKSEVYETSPRKKIKLSLTEHGKKYFNWLEPIYEPISDTIFLENKLMFNDNRKSNIIKLER